MTDLVSLGKRHGTDKFQHGYLPYYEKHLQGEVKSLLEIGVLDGKSLRMWAEFFPEAEIYGLDIEPDCKKHESDRIHITIGSQDDPELLSTLVRDAGGFDVVIDDGSHVNSLTLASFNHLWPHTRLAYVIEDLDCSYMDLTSHVKSWPGMKHNRGMDYRNDRSEMDRFFAARIADVDGNKDASVHFYPRLALMMCGERTDLTSHFQRCNELMVESGVDYWASCGTLLGIVREGRLLAHDQDIDFSTFEWTRHEDIARVFTDAGFEMRTNGVPHHGYQQAFFLEGVHICDVFYFYPLPESVWQGSWLGERLLVSEFEPDIFLPTQPFDFNGIETRLPAKPESVLEARYGDWRTPVLEWDYSSDPKCLAP